jgi:putative selenate reductase
MDFDTIIPAIGQDTIYDCIPRDDLKVDPETMMTKLPKVYAGGDAVHGPLNLITAIGDGRKAAADMIAIVSGKKVGRSVKSAKKGLFAFERQKKSATRIMGARASLVPVDMRDADTLVINSLDEQTARLEAARCLACNDVCNVCVTLCPNRANFSYKPFAVKLQLSKIVNEGGKAVAKPDRLFAVSQRTQTANIAGFCNECGNCATFCPTAGAPYKDKPKMCLTEESFTAEERGFIITRGKGSSTIHARVHGDVETLTLVGGKIRYSTPRLDVSLRADDFSVIKASLKNGAAEHDLEQAAAMFVLLKSLGGSHLY